MTLDEWFKQANFKGYKMAPLMSSKENRNNITYTFNININTISNTNDRERIVATWMGYDNMPNWYDPKLRRRLRDKLRRDNKPEKVTQPKLPFENDDPVRKILDDIDEILKHNTQQARDLWMILTALRGPDDGNLSAKDTFTCFIRSKAFPKTAGAKKNGNGVYQPVFGYSPGPIDPLTFKNLSFHYKGHLYSAAQSLVNRGVITKDECPEQIRFS